MHISSAQTKFSDIEIDLLLSHLLKKPREFLCLEPNFLLSKSMIDRLKVLVKKRRSGWPIAYLIGYKDFYGLSLKVSRATLIPRPETEWIISRSLQIIKSIPKPKIIDIGTGSGCIAISIAKHSPTANIKAVDLSKAALKIAKENATIHKVKIKFTIQNLLLNDRSKYDLIIANLPYVKQTDYLKLKNQLSYEPKLALVDLKADFWLYDQLLCQAPKHLYPNGKILLEIDPSMKSKLIYWRKKKMPSASLRFTKDIQGLVRYCEISFSA